MLFHNSYSSLLCQENANYLQSYTPKTGTYTEGVQTNHPHYLWVTLSSFYWDMENGNHISLSIVFAQWGKLLISSYNIGDTRDHFLCSHLKNVCWPNCTIIRITLQLCFKFCTLYFRSHFSGVCDLEQLRNTILQHLMCVRRKMEWPQSLLTHCGFYIVELCEIQMTEYWCIACTKYMEKMEERPVHSTAYYLCMYLISAWCGHSRFDTSMLCGVRI